MAYPFVEAVFPLVGASPGFPTKLVVMSAEFRHELAVLTFPQKGAYYPQFMTGTPVYIRYGTKAVLDTFVGYVDHVRPNAAMSSPNASATPTTHSFSVVCVGASWPMKSGGQRVFRGLTAHAIASSVLSKYGLSADADPHGRVWATRAQAGCSDWSFLVDMAHDIGYTLLPERTLIRFHPATRDFSKMAPQAVTFDVNRSVTTGVAIAQPQIRSFKAAIGEAIPDSSGTTRARRIAYSYDIRQNAITQVVDETGSKTTLTTQNPAPVFTQYTTGLSSRETLDDTATSMTGSREDARWHVTAEASLVGDARVRAGRLLYTKNLPSDYSGYWYVRSATHTFSFDAGPSLRPGNYTMTVSLGRDGSGSSFSTPTTHPVRDIKPTGGIDAPPAAKLTSKGRWESEFHTTAILDVPRPSYVVRRLANR